MRRAGFICRSCLAHAQKSRPRPLLQAVTRGIASRPAVLANLPRGENDASALSPSPFEPQSASANEDPHQPDNDRKEDDPKRFPKILPWIFSPEATARHKRQIAAQRRMGGQRRMATRRRMAAQQQIATQRQKAVYQRKADYQNKTVYREIAIHRAPHLPRAYYERKALRRKRTLEKVAAEAFWWMLRFRPIAMRLVETVVNPETARPAKYAPKGPDIFELLMEKTPNRMAARWSHLTEGQWWGGRRQRFQNLMLDVLHIAPDRAHRVLHAIFDKSHASPWATRCCISLFVQLYYAMKTRLDCRGAAIDVRATNDTALNTDLKKEAAFDTNPTEQATLAADPTENTAFDTYPTQEMALVTVPKQKTVEFAWTLTHYAEEVVNMVIHIIEQSGRNRVYLHNKTLSKLAGMASPSGVAALYQALKRYPLQLNVFSRLKFAGHMAMEPSHKPLAVEILSDLVQREGVARDSAHIAALVTAIFTFSAEDARNPNYNEIRARLFEEIMGLGIELNLINYTALIRNLCLTGDMDVALQVSEAMREQGIKPDGRLFSVLIHGGKLAGDWSLVERFVCEIAETGRGIGDPIIYNDLIHCLHKAYLDKYISKEEGFTRRADRVVPAFPTMLQAYAKFFDMEPLQRLLPMHDLEQIVRETEDSQLTRLAQGSWISDVAPILRKMDRIKPQQVLEPRPDTIRIMLVGYIDSLSNAYHLSSFCVQFRRLIQSGDPLLCQVVKNDTTIHDRILLSLAEWPGLIRVSMELVNEMLSDSIQVLDRRLQGKLSGGYHPAPSAHTWSILLKGMGRAKQITLSRRLLALMHTHGFAPCSVSWNVLVGTYARVQDVQGTMNALQERKRAGFEPNDYTFTALSHLRNKTEALERVKSQYSSFDRLVDLRRGITGFAETLNRRTWLPSLRAMDESAATEIFGRRLAEFDDKTIDVTIGDTD